VAKYFHVEHRYWLAGNGMTQRLKHQHFFRS
jgi:hypothetical protein